MSELWLPTLVAPDRYSVSNKGRVRNDLTGTIRVPGVGKPPNDYQSVDWKTAGKRIHLKVHILVLEVWVEPRPEGMLGLHRNDDHQDNRVENLYWGTQTQNMQDRIRNGKNPMLAKTHCRNHPDELLVQVQWGETIKRVCRSCRRDHDRRYNASRKVAV